MKKTNLFLSCLFGVTIIVPNTLQAEHKQKLFGFEVYQNDNDNVNKITVKGKVLDETGQSMISVTIREVGNNNNGVVTDLDGNYVIKVPKGATLSYSYIGYKTKEVVVDKPEIDVTLEPSSTSLNEVVVVGYGTQKKKDLTTSIASINSKDMVGKPVSSVAEAMVGRLPGVQISQNTGSPGSGLSIKVRGIGTITAGSSPLYVIDGVPASRGAMDALNMNDIASIQVLKDASSAAIYGSRGANGVVIIETKQGGNESLKVSYASYFGIQSVSKKINMLDAYGYSRLVRDARNNSYMDKMEAINIERESKHKSPINFSVNDDNATRLSNTKNDFSTIIPQEILPYLQGEKGLTNTDWQDQIFRNASIQNHSISFSGGSKKVKYYASLGYFDQNGIVINSDYKRYSARLNVTLNQDIFKFGFNIAPSFIKENEVNSDGPYLDEGVIASALFSAPIFPVYNQDGSFNFAQNDWSNSTPTKLQSGKTVYGNGQTWVLNPVALAKLKKNKNNYNRLIGNTFAEVKILPYMQYRVNFGVNLSSSNSAKFRPSTIPLSNTKGNPSSIATGSSSTHNNYGWTLEQLVSLNKSFGNHHLSGIAGWTMQYQQNNSNYIFANNFLTNDIQTLNAGVVTKGNSKSEEWTLLSALARFQYNYKDTYMLSGALRADGASRFGFNSKWGYFPSVSVGWRLTNEPFMKGQKIFDDLKLRASYGLTGNFNIPVYGYLGEMDYVNYVLGGTSPSVVKGAVPDKLPNPDLHWEKTAQVNIGFDASLLNHSITIGLDLYNSNTYDLLLDVPIPKTTGFSRRLENVGKVNNKGVEFNIGTNYSTNTLTWSTYFNISKNINKVVALGPSNAPIITYGSVKNAYFITKVGYPIGSYYLPIAEGVYRDQKDVNSSPHYIDSKSNYGLNTSKPGDIKYKDVNGDGKIDVDDTDRAIVGNYQPKFTFGFGTNLEWKNWDCAINFNGVYGNKILNLSKRYFLNSEGNMNNYAVVDKRWKSPTDVGNGIIPRANRVSKGKMVPSTFFLEDGSYIRIKNITIGYSLPKTFSKKILIEQMRVYTTFENVFTFTKYSGYNPEVSNRTAATKSGEDYGVYPLARTVSLGLNITF